MSTETQAQAVTRESVAISARAASTLADELYSLLAVLEHATFNGCKAIEPHIKSVLATARSMADDVAVKTDLLESDILNIGETAQ